MATTTTPAPVAPPTLTIISTHGTPLSASTSAAKIQIGLTRRQTSLVSSAATAANISPPTSNPVTSQHQRPSLSLQTTVQSPISTSTHSRGPAIGSQPPSAGCSTQLYSPTSATSSSQALALGPQTQAHACSSTSSPIPLQSQLQPQLQPPSPSLHTPASSLISTLNSVPAQLPNTSPQVQQSAGLSTLNSPILTSTPPRQATPSPQAPIAPKALPLAPRNLVQRVSDRIGVWTTIGLTAVAVVIAIYYGAIMLSYAKWTKHNDFREGCISDREHELPLSAECLEELLRPRASVAKRQIECKGRRGDVVLDKVFDYSSHIAHPIVAGWLVAMAVDSLRERLKMSILAATVCILLLVSIYLYLAKILFFQPLFALRRHSRRICE